MHIAERMRNDDFIKHLDKKYPIEIVKTGLGAAALITLLDRNGDIVDVVTMFFNEQGYAYYENAISDAVTCFEVGLLNEEWKKARKRTRDFFRKGGRIYPY